MESRSTSNRKLTDLASPPLARQVLAKRTLREPRARGSLDQALITAAMDLFASYGYRGTSLARIARAAGVTKGALYWHFADKEEFFVAVVRKVLSEWNSSFRMPPSVGKKAYRDEFVRWFGTLADLNSSNPWVTRLLLIIALESHKIGPRVLRIMRTENLRSVATVQALIGRGKAAGLFDRRLDVEWAATQLVASYFGLAMMWYLHGERFSLKRTLSQQAREFLRQWSAG